MKKFKFIYLLLAVVGALTFASCEHKYADWTPGPQDTNMGVYFPSTSGFVVAATDTSVDIAVARSNADEAASVSLRYAALNGAGEATELFTIPSQVEFAAGEKESKLTITFDGSQLNFGEKYALTIKLDEKEASKYAIAEYTYTIMVPEPWISMGEGIYFDEVLCMMFAEPDGFRGLGAYVEFEQHELEPNRLRAKDVYSPATLGAMWGLVPSWMSFISNDTTYVEFDITDPNNVIVGDVIELSNGTSTIKACMVSMNVNVDGKYDLAFMVYEDTPIVLQDGIVKFPQGAVELSAFGGGQYLGYFDPAANANGFMQFYLPGTEFVNYDISAAYDGMYVSADGSTAKAIFNFALGGDVASYKFAFVTGDVSADPSAVAEAIVAGSEELVIFESDAETRKWEVELTKGVWTLVVVPYTAEGEARLQNTFAHNFYFNGTGEMPEVNVAFQVGTPASFAAEEDKAAVEAEYPACFNIGLNIAADASQFKSIRAWWGSTKSYNNTIAKGSTDADIIDKYSADLTSFIDKFAGGAVTVPMKVDNYASNFTVLVRIETIYGTTIEEKLEYTIPAYDGEFAVGEYTFLDATTESQMVFSLVPGSSYNDFYFVHSYIEGYIWYATLDSEAGTLVNEGIAPGYEDYGPIWGYIHGYMADYTQAYSYLSSTKEDYSDSSAMVMTVADNAITGLQTYYGMVVMECNPETGETGETLGFYYNFTPATQIAPAAGVMQARAENVNAKFAAKTAEMKPCVVDSVIASEAEVVIKATPVAPNFTMANITLK